MFFGEVLGYTRSGNSFKISTIGGEVTLKFINERIVNIFAPIERSEQVSKAIEDLQNKIAQIDLVVLDDQELMISSSALTVEVKNPFRLIFKDVTGKVINEDYLPSIEEKSDIVNVKSVSVCKKLNSDEHFYGFGEKTGFLDKAGEEMEMWCSDIPEPHVPSIHALYKSIPFFVGFNRGEAYGIFFDNTYKTYFDMGKSSPEYYSFAADGGNLDYYFIYGPEIKEVMQNYTYLTGRMNLPPLWVLGYQQCRWSYCPDSQVKEIATMMREQEIPCDVIYLDIDYMDGFRVFTWDEEKFSNPTKMLTELGEMGFKVVTIVDPGVKKDSGYSVYREALQKGYYVRDKDGIPYVGKVWPGDCIFPDFTAEEVRDWWGSLHKSLLDAGVAGIWNDMNEPAIFTIPSEDREPEEVKTMPLTNLHQNDGRQATHDEMHNVYGLMMSKATYQGLSKLSQKRPFVLTRAAYAGIQKYSALWTGDNHSFWDHLEMSLPMCMNLGMSGVAFVGTDVGGFQYDCTPELLSRWVQVGCFTPFFRNHSSKGTKDQEPWAFDMETKEINRKYIRLRYKLMPYIYNVFVEASRSGLPIMRPLVLEYPNDPEVYQIYDQFMFGSSLLVAPVITPGTNYRHIYLPAGEWYDYFTGDKYMGEQHMVFFAPLDVLPLFVKAGSVIPNYEPVNYIGEKKMENLYLEIYPGNGEYEYYEDDGETMAYLHGEYNQTGFTLQDNVESLVITITDLQREYVDGVKDYILHIGDIKAQKVLINEVEEEIIYTADKLIITLSVGEKYEIKIVK